MDNVLISHHREEERLQMLIASLSKCRLCCQYHYSAGKQPITVLVREISFHSYQKMVEICVFQHGDTLFMVDTIQNLIWGCAEARLWRSAVLTGVIKGLLSLVFALNYTYNNLKRLSKLFTLT